MSIQLTPFAWVLGAMICALPVAAFIKTKYPAFLSSRARGRGRVSAHEDCVSARENMSAQGQVSGQGQASASVEEPAFEREKREESPTTPYKSAEESFFARFIEQWFKLAFIFELFTFMFTNLGYFAKVNERFVGYDFVASMVVFGLSLILLRYKKCDTRVLIVGGALLFSIFLGVLSCAARPYKPGVIMDFDGYVLGFDVGFVKVKPSFAMFKTAFVVVRLVVNFSVAAKIFGARAEKMKIAGALLWLGRVMVVYGFFEIVVKKSFGVNLTERYYNPFFGETPHTFALVERYQGLYKEPSHYATYFSFFGFLALLKLVGDRNKMYSCGAVAAIADNVFFFAIVFLLAYSTSFGAYLYVVLLLFMYFWFYVSPKGKFFWAWGFLLLAAAAFIVVGCTSLKTKWNLDRMYERASSFCYSLFRLLKGDDATFTSEGARLTSAFFALKYFAARPLLGIGLSYVESNTTTLSLLGSVGLAGTALLVCFYAAFARTSKKSAFFCVCVYFSMTTLGWLGFAFATIIPVTFMYAEIMLAGEKGGKGGKRGRTAKTAGAKIPKEKEAI